MKTGELESVQAEYQMKVENIRASKARADIHTALLANGVIVIEKG